MTTAELRKIAEAATPGPWWTNHVGATAGETIRRQVGNQPVARLSPDDRDSLGIPGAEGAERARKAIAQTTADATHIATFDPPTILALLDVVEAAERELATIERWAGEQNAGNAFAEQVRYWALAKRAALVARLESVAVPETPTIENPVSNQEFDPKDLG